jgi:serine acetyltransferase
MKKYLRPFYLTSLQVGALIRLSIFVSRGGSLGRLLGTLLDNLLLHLYGIEVMSRSLEVRNLVVGHSTGVVLGGNGIRCTGTLHLSSGVVFARRYGPAGEQASRPLFVFDGDVTVGANSVLMGPLSIKGPVVIGALTLVSRDITEPGIYVGTPAKKLRDLQPIPPILACVTPRPGASE